ncbi:hypothetical protein RHSIM_Rhsim10G0003800 [Rhododendron simsii]|uniref:Exocyst subunit Exo70 family protein n=1 Tax=Rhododendron simsii TaxID=118357 RepID=A0A834LC26_RHOSS|nr:hypothetical protein RHSIM_Rhsim10G0003800 [Rhododendron simsii]
MEWEKDKQHHPEKSHSFSPRDTAGQDNNDHHHHPSDPNPNLQPEQDPDHTNDTTNAANSESPKEADSKPDNTESEEKEDDKEEGIGETTEEESHPPPDFDQVCQEIDQFISTLSTAKGCESDPPELPEAMEHFPFLVEAKIANYDSTESLMKWNQLSEEDSSLFLVTVDRLSKLITSLTSFSSESSYASSINRIGGILQRAMSYLEDEFRSLLEDPKIPDFDKIDESKAKQASSSSNSNQEADNSVPEEPKSTEDDSFPGYSDEVMSDLSRLAKAMITGGYEAECYQVYIVTRRTVLEETLHKLGFEKFSIDDIQKMQWEPLEREIVSWNKTFKQFVAVVFKGERKLSAAVFGDDGEGEGGDGDSVFSSVTRGIMIQLLNFAAAVGMTKRSSEKLFKFLDIYENLRDVILAMDDLFVEGTVNELKSEASLIRTRLGESMVSIFCELENSIKTDTGKTPVAGGAVHPLTRYTMNYLRYACEYKDTLEQIFREHQQIERADSATGSDYDYTNSQGSNSSSSCQNQVNQTSVKQSPFTVQINKVMDLLDMNIGAKSKLYRDPLLSSIFMMNNDRYILQKVKGSPEFTELMGDTWSRKRSSDIRNCHKKYRESWGRLLHCLSHEGLTVQGKVVKPVLKERFKSFNAMFDEIHKTQSTWVVSDEQLQSELRVSIVSVVIPAYRAFMARFSQNFTPGRQTEKYIKYQAEDIETYIDELFDGNAGGAAWKKKP